MIDQKTAIQWALESNFKTMKGPTLFHLVTPENVQALVDRAMKEAFAQAAAACVHYESGEGDDMALQCKKHILALMNNPNSKARS